MTPADPLSSDDLFDHLEQLDRMLQEAPQDEAILELRADLTRLTAELREVEASPLPPEATLAFAQALSEDIDRLVEENKAQIAEASEAEESGDQPADDFEPWDGDAIAASIRSDPTLSFASAPGVPEKSPAPKAPGSKPAAAAIGAATATRPASPPAGRAGSKPKNEFDSWHDL